MCPSIPAFRGLWVIVAMTMLASSPTAAEIPRTNPNPYAAPPDKALLVFVRPRQRQASETELRVVNEAGRCLALLDGGWQMAAPMWPGKHMLLLITGTAPPVVQLLHAKVSAGKTYVVQLRTRVNIKNPIDIEVVRRSDQPLEAFPPEVREQSPFKRDLRKCTEWVSWKRSKIEPKAETAKRRWDDATEEFRDDRTVRRNDGWSQAEVTDP